MWADATIIFPGLIRRLQVSDAIAHVQIPIVAQRVEICTQLAGEYGVEL